MNTPATEVRDLRGLLSLKRKPVKRQEQGDGLRVRIRNSLVAQYFPEMDRYYGSCEVGQPGNCEKLSIAGTDSRDGI